MRRVPPPLPEKGDPRREGNRGQRRILSEVWTIIKLLTLCGLLVTAIDYSADGELSMGKEGWLALLATGAGYVVVGVVLIAANGGEDTLSRRLARLLCGVVVAALVLSYVSNCSDSPCRDNRSVTC